MLYPFAIFCLSSFTSVSTQNNTTDPHSAATLQASSMLPPSVAPRPALDGHCTCVWPSEFERQTKIVAAYEEAQSRLDVVTNPMSSLAALPGKIAHSVSMQMPGSLSAGGPETPAVEEKQSAIHIPASSGCLLPPHQDFYAYTLPSDSSRSHMGNGDAFSTSTMSKGSPIKITDEQVATSKKAELRESQSRLASKRGQLKKGMAAQTSFDTPTRKIKRVFTFSAEMKLRDLLSYREDLVILLRTLIPTYNQAESIHPVAKHDTRLCVYCSSILAYSLYHSPSRLSRYLSEASTRAYLALIDDATSSLACDVRMESLSHHDLEYILRGELAVVEWRMALKIARLHQKTGIADLFPMKIGQFAELYQSRDEPSMQPEGLLKKGGKMMASLVGIGSGPTSHPQVAKAAVKQATVA